MKFSSITTVVLLLLVSPCSFSTIYKWVDENGVTHYSDRPPQPDAQAIDDSLPGLQPMAPPDKALTAIQRAAAKDRKQMRSQTNRRRRYQRRTSSRCTSYQHRLRKIQAQLRRGYSEPRGNKLREKRRALQALVNSQCR